MQTIPPIPDVRGRRSLRVPALPVPVAGSMAQGGGGMMDARELGLLLVARRRMLAWRRRWVWTFGALLVAIVVIEAMIAGRI